MSISPAIDTFINNIDASAAAYLDACVHCGQCAEACHFYDVTGDVRYTPIWKLEPMRRVYKRHKAPLSGLKKIFNLVPDEINEEMLKDWEELLYDSCTLCGRCTVVCPMGIDIAGLVRKSREAMVAAELVPEGLVGAAKRTIEIGSPLGIKPVTLAKIVAEQVEEVGIPIELDKVGADYMIILSAMEILNFYEVIGALARIFKQAGITWTISTEAYEATNAGIQMGDKEIARILVQRIVDAAEKLQVKYVVSPECGHAYSALNWEGPNLVGKNYDFKVIHILELLDQLVREGRLKTKTERDHRRVTFHDPCQIVRRGGIVQEPRNLLHAVSDNFVEMENSGVANICCGGGGGVSSNSRAEGLRIKSFGAKKKQLDAVKPDALVTACGNCRNVLEEALEEHGMDLPVLGLTELVAQYLDD